MDIIEWKCILFIVSGNVICLRICFENMQPEMQSWSFKNVNILGGLGSPPPFLWKLSITVETFRKSSIIIITHQVNLKVLT